jgi:hypothetical protein
MNMAKADDKRLVGTKIKKDEDGRRTLNFQVWFKDKDEEVGGRDEDTPIIDLIEHLMTVEKWSTRRIATVAMNLLYQKLSDGESIATEFGAAMVNKSMLTILQQAMDMQAKALQVFEMMEGMELSPADRDQFRQKKTDLVSTGEKMVKASQDAGIITMNKAGNFAGQFYMGGEDEDEDDE